MASKRSDSRDHEAKPGGRGLRGPDKQQSALRDPTTRAQRTPKRQAVDTPRAPEPDETPEGLQRPRKGPIDRNVGRDEAADQVPSNWGRNNT